MTNKLPPYCFTIDPKDGKIVRLNRGKKGYEPLDSITSKYSLAIQEAFLIGGKHLRDKARIVSRDGMNEEIGVTKQQHDAMLHGSHFGFDNPAVDKILKGGQMTKCPDKLEPLSDSDMLLFIKLTIEDLMCAATSDIHDGIEVESVERALKYIENLKEKSNE